MKYVVTYDVPENRIRNQIAEVLEGVGTRVQKSVFECRLDERGLEDLARRLTGELVEPENGEIRIYRLCEHCENAAFGLGEVATSEGEAAFVV